MDEVTKCTIQLSRALRESDACKAFRSASRKLDKRPGLREKINGFRKRNYLLQNNRESGDLFDEMAQLEREYEELRKDELAGEYLDTELEICRMLQRCSSEILSSVDLQIENFLDVIEI